LRPTKLKILSIKPLTTEPQDVQKNVKRERKLKVGNPTIEDTIAKFKDFYRLF